MLPETAEIEQKTLDRVKAGKDTRLACQVIPRGGAIRIERLLPPYIEPKDLRRAVGGKLKPADGDATPEAAK